MPQSLSGFNIVALNGGTIEGARVPYLPQNQSLSFLGKQSALEDSFQTVSDPRRE